MLSRTGGARPRGRHGALFSNVIGGPTAMRSGITSRSCSRHVLLTTVDAGPCRTVHAPGPSQHVWTPIGRGHGNPGGAFSGLVVAIGLLPYQGVHDPLGGINHCGRCRNLQSVAVGGGARVATTIIIKWEGALRLGDSGSPGLAGDRDNDRRCKRSFHRIRCLAFLAHARMLGDKVAAGQLPPGAKSLPGRDYSYHRIDAAVAASSSHPSRDLVASAPSGSRSDRRKQREPEVPSLRPRAADSVIALLWPVDREVNITAAPLDGYLRVVADRWDNRRVDV